MPLAELSPFHDIVPIIPDSGLQFLDFGLATGRDQPMPERWGFYADENWPLTGSDLPVLVSREVGGEAAGEGRVTCEVDLRDIEAMFEGRWMPLPLFRRDLSGSFFRGPTNWARVYLHRLKQPSPEGHSHRVVVALDTRLVPFVESEAYVAPSAEDARNGRPFLLPSWRDPIDWYLQEEWVRDWCIETAKEMVEARARAAARGRYVQPPSLEAVRDWMRDEGKPMLHLAAYRAYLDWLQSAGILPSIVIVDRSTEGQAAPVDVDLVLDLGNSRSCGLLVEADPTGSGSDITHAVSLALRDLSLPVNVHAEPFSSRIEFSRASFGRDHLSLRSGLADRFSWPSIVRVGPEAVRLAGLRRGSEGASGLSSPKRYLWDGDPRRDSWRFNSPFIPGEQSDIATGVAFTTLVNDLGEALHRLPPDTPVERSLPSVRALYARRNLMSFALAEIVLQALCMMNSPGHRVRRHASERLPRRLRRLIMTIPTAMPLAERQILQAQAQAACELAYMSLGLAELQPGPDGRPVLHYAPDARRSRGEPLQGPEVRLQWDEASATQAIWLYTQIATAYSGDALALFDAVRHPVNRADPAMERSLRIATLDVGGGTTDLVITRLDVEGRGANVTVTPAQEFREGFNLAGDDALYRVVQEHVLGPLRRHLAEGPLGPERTEALLSRLFGGDRGDMKVSEQLRRQQFAAQVATPVAIALLEAYENADPLDPPAVERRRVGDILQQITGEAPPDAAIAHVNDELRRAGVEGFDLCAVELPIDPAEIDRTVRAVFLEMLQSLGEMVWRFRCDLLLLSGRPSRLPAVSGILRESGCLPPMRIVPLHSFRVGPWYPFRDARATIADPKTTAAVGAMICLLAEGHLPDFNYRSDLLRPASTARFFGKLDRNNRLLKGDEFFREMRLEDPDWSLPESGFEFRGPMPLGFRQMAEDWWPATRLYSLAYAEGADAGALQRRTPLTVYLKPAKPEDRRERVAELFEIQRIEDRDGRSVDRRQLRLRLQTIDNQAGYWLDTGVLLDQ